MKTLWGSRFSEGLDKLAWDYNASIGFDWRLAEVDVQGSIIWAKALMQAGILSPKELELMVGGLENVLVEIQSGEFVIKSTDEDVHTAIERRLTEFIGKVGGKLHTGRSRNDQVITDFTVWLVNTIDEIDGKIYQLQAALEKRAKIDLGIIMPGLTHTQQSQPVYLSHWWLSFFWPLVRDRERLTEIRQRAAVIPLGSGAMAGTPYPVDRAALAKEFGEFTITQNSIDAVSNRDSAAEFLFAASLIAIHLSKISSVLIQLSSYGYGYFQIADAYTTGSSLMPQKKNPDTLELTRGKAGTIIGRLTGILAMLKGLPSAYDKDLQEDKTAVFETYDTLCLMLPIMAGLIETLNVNKKNIKSSMDEGMLATDLADYLVKKGVPFREAHDAVGKIARYSELNNISLNVVPINMLRRFHAKFEKDAMDLLDFETSANLRDVVGGTSMKAVKAQMKKVKAYLSDNR